MSERDDVDLIATVLDHPSLYMGGPSDRSKRMAERILRALREAGRTYEQGVKDGEARVSLRAEVLAKAEANESLRNAALSAQLAQAREALEKADRAINAAYEQAQAEYQCHDKRAAKYDAIVATGRQAIRTTLAALTAGSTEGKDGE